jgi:exodeoxyribonuclease VII small subunit
MGDDRKNSDVADLSFEQAQAELEQIVERLEDQQTGLEEALTLWERGEALHAHCQSKLDYAAQRIEKLTVSQDEANAVAAEQPDEFSGNGAAAAEPQPEPRQPVAPPEPGTVQSMF